MSIKKQNRRRHGSKGGKLMTGLRLVTESGQSHMVLSFDVKYILKPPTFIGDFGTSTQHNR